MPITIRTKRVNYQIAQDYNSRGRLLRIFENLSHTPASHIYRDYVASGIEIHIGKPMRIFTETETITTSDVLEFWND